jgi:hypothetical protein
MVVKIESGQLEPKRELKNLDILKSLFWTIGQVWNNHSDTAILFDANGLEIDRHSYPSERLKGSSANSRKALIRNNDGYEIVNDSLRRAQKATRK